MVPTACGSLWFAITRPASGQWLLDWLWTSANNELGLANNLGYPTVHMATSADLVRWSAVTEMHLPWSRRWPQSVALAQDPGTGVIHALFEQHRAPVDYYIVGRTSTTRRPAISARRRRRSISSVLPLNMQPLITWIHPSAMLTV